jgi:hypothetical protein
MHIRNSSLTANCQRAALAFTPKRYRLVAYNQVPHLDSATEIPAREHDAWSLTIVRTRRADWVTYS